jgi:hypothetical protein
MSAEYVDLCASSPERDLSQTRRFVIDCTTPTPTASPERAPIDCTTTPDDSLRTKRAREELACPGAPKKARVARVMMVSPTQLFPPPVSVRLHCTQDDVVKVVLSYNDEYM